MTIKALIFDFDGLILETEGPIYQSWQELYRAYGYDLPLSRWATVIGTANFYFDPYRELEDMLGREVSVLVKERREAGVHEVQFDGNALASGVNFYRLQAGDFVAIKKLLVLR